MINNKHILFNELNWTEIILKDMDEVNIYRHICLPIIPGRGVDTETCRVDDVFAPNDIWFGSGTYPNMFLYFDF